MNLTEVKYNRDILNVLCDVKKLNNSFIISKGEEQGEKRLNIFTKEKDSHSIFLMFSTKAENFDFEGDQIAFIDYDEFYSFFKSLGQGDVRIQQSENVFILSKNKTKISYLLTDPTLKLLERTTFKKINRPPTNLVSFNLTKEQYKEICGAVSLLDAKTVTIKVYGKTIHLNIHNEKSDHSTEMEFESNEEANGELEFPISSDIFKIKIEYDYTVTIYKEMGGMVEFSFVCDEFSFEMFAGRQAST